MVDLRGESYDKIIARGRQRLQQSKGRVPEGGSYNIPKGQQVVLSSVEKGVILKTTEEEAKYRVDKRQEPEKTRVTIIKPPQETEGEKIVRLQRQEETKDYTVLKDPTERYKAYLRYKGLSPYGIVDMPGTSKPLEREITKEKKAQDVGVKTGQITQDYYQKTLERDLTPSEKRQDKARYVPTEKYLQVEKREPTQATVPLSVIDMPDTPTTSAQIKPLTPQTYDFPLKKKHQIVDMLRFSDTQPFPDSPTSVRKEKVKYDSLSVPFETQAFPDSPTTIPFISSDTYKIKRKYALAPPTKEKTTIINDGVIRQIGKSIVEEVKVPIKTPYKGFKAILMKGGVLTPPTKKDLNFAEFGSMKSQPITEQTIDYNELNKQIGISKKDIITTETFYGGLLAFEYLPTKAVETGITYSGVYGGYKTTKGIVEKNTKEIAEGVSFLGGYALMKYSPKIGQKLEKPLSRVHEKYFTQEVTPKNLLAMFQKDIVVSYEGGGISTQSEIVLLTQKGKPFKTKNIPKPRKKITVDIGNIKESQNLEFIGKELAIEREFGITTGEGILTLKDKKPTINIKKLETVSHIEGVEKKYKIPNLPTQYTEVTIGKPHMRKIRQKPKIREFIEFKKEGYIERDFTFDYKDVEAFYEKPTKTIVLPGEATFQTIRHEYIHFIDPKVENQQIAYFRRSNKALKELASLGKAGKKRAKEIKQLYPKIDWEIEARADIMSLYPSQMKKPTTRVAKEISRIYREPKLEKVSKTKSYELYEIKIPRRRTEFLTRSKNIPIKGAVRKRTFTGKPIITKSIISDSPKGITKPLRKEISFTRLIPKARKYERKQPFIKKIQKGKTPKVIDLDKKFNKWQKEQNILLSKTGGGDTDQNQLLKSITQIEQTKSRRQNVVIDYERTRPKLETFLEEGKLKIKPRKTIRLYEKPATTRMQTPRLKSIQIQEMQQKRRYPRISLLKPESRYKREQRLIFKPIQEPITKQKPMIGLDRMSKQSVKVASEFKQDIDIIQKSRQRTIRRDKMFKIDKTIRIPKIPKIDLELDQEVIGKRRRKKKYKKPTKQLGYIPSITAQAFDIKLPKSKISMKGLTGLELRPIVR